LEKKRDRCQSWSFFKIGCSVIWPKTIESAYIIPTQVLVGIVIWSKTIWSRGIWPRQCFGNTVEACHLLKKWWRGIWPKTIFSIQKIGTNLWSNTMWLTGIWPIHCFVGTAITLSFGIKNSVIWPKAFVRETFGQNSV
jgi:hypothetical protein